MRAAKLVKPTAPLRGIQALRAAACLAVVTYHAAETISGRAGPGAPAWLRNGAAGVDVFFVVSGFVMVLSARKLAGQPGAARRFARDRLRRIVPLYWLCSGLKILAVLAAPRLASGTLTLGYCVASLLFLPLHDADGRFKPVLSAGWTLSFEMLFYALFTVALAARRAPALWVPPVLAAAVLLLPLAGPVAGELGNPMVLEFAFGTTLATVWLRGWRLPDAAAWPLLVSAFALLAMVPKLALGTRLLSWGVPSACLVAALVSLECRIGPRLPKVVLALGGASYAIYLTHGFVVAGLGLALARLPAWARGAGFAVPLDVAASAAAGWLVHVAIERKANWRRRRGTGAPRSPEVLVLAGGGLSPTSGGVGTLMRNLMDSWAEGVSPPRVRIADTRGSGGAFDAAFHFAGAVCLVVWLCASRRVELVHAHMTTRGSAARKAVLGGLAMALGVPVILHMHGADFMQFHRRLTPVLRWPLNVVLRRACHVVVLGRAWRSFLVEEAGVLPERISIVPNGVPRETASCRQGDASVRILFLGRLCARKGVPELISALALPALRGLDWVATIAGDGNAAPFRAMVGWHGLQGRVALPGWAGRAETAALLAQADILVLPSYHEALPLAVLEALAAGVAVITTPVGAIPEFLEHGRSALLVKPGAPAELAAAILLLVQSPDLRARLAQGGHAVFREKLEIGRVAARMAALYRDATRLPAQAAE